MHFQQIHSLQQSTLHEQKSSAPDFAHNRPFNWGVIAWAFIAIGIFLRIFHYLENRSLWIDEVYLATSLIEMDFLQLTSPTLAYEQKAPIGFLWMVRLAVVAFGKGEMALRLFPLITGIATLFVFRPVARFLLKPMGMAVAMGIISLAPPLVYHAVEVKQYGTEALAAALALYLYTRYNGKLTTPQLLLWGLWGAVLVWFSYAVIFVLAGIAFAVCLTHLIRKDWKALFLSFIPFSIWLISFATNYFLFIYKHTDSGWLVEWFRHREAFMPLPPTSFADLKWFLARTLNMLDYPLGLLWRFTHIIRDNKLLQAILNLHFIPIPFLLAGFITLYRKDKTTWMVLIFPLFLALLASGLQVYPFYERLLVFLAPPMILIIAYGTQKIAGYFSIKSTWYYLTPFVILLGPLHASAQQVYNPELFGGRKHWHLREALLYVHERAKENDVVYINWNAIPEYRFYDRLYNFKFRVIEGKDVRKESTNIKEYFYNLQPDLTAMRSYDRAWVVLNKEMGANIGEVEKTEDLFGKQLKNGKHFVEHLSRLGEQKDAYLSKDIDVFLFDFPKN